MSAGMLLCVSPSASFWQIIYLIAELEKKFWHVWNLMLASACFGLFFVSDKELKCFVRCFHCISSWHAWQHEEGYIYLDIWPKAINSRVILFSAELEWWGPWSDLNSQSWVAPLTYLLTDQQITNTCPEQQTQCLEIYGCALKAK